MHTRLREERRKRGWTQARLARTLHIDHSSVSHYETCFSRPRAPVAQALADIFGIPAEELLSAPAALTKTTGAAPKEDHGALQRD